MREEQDILDTLNKVPGPLQHIGDTSIRRLLETANDLNLKRNEVINIIRGEGQYILIYYR